jgi:hypothetical protein
VSQNTRNDKLLSYLRTSGADLNTAGHPEACIAAVIHHMTNGYLSKALDALLPWKLKATAANPA